MEKEIIIASGNKGKIKEAQEILKGYKIIPIKEFGVDIDVEEDKDTFEENAIKKAQTISKELNGKLSGRGGGSTQMAQGTFFADEEKVCEVLHEMGFRRA